MDSTSLRSRGASPHLRTRSAPSKSTRLNACSVLEGSTGDGSVVMLWNDRGGCCLVVLVGLVSLIEVVFLVERLRINQAAWAAAK